MESLKIKAVQSEDGKRLSEAWSHCDAGTAARQVLAVASSHVSYHAEVTSYHPTPSNRYEFRNRYVLSQLALAGLAIYTRDIY